LIFVVPFPAYFIAGYEKDLGNFSLSIVDVCLSGFKHVSYKHGWAKRAFGL